jgi:hypothetical protein
MASVAMTPAMWAAYLADGFIGQIPVWDQSLQNQVGYRTSFDSANITLINGFTSTPGAVLYSPDFVGNLVEIDIPSSGGTAGTIATGTGSTATAAGLLNLNPALPGWAFPAAIGGALVLVLMLMTGKSPAR